MDKNFYCYGAPGYRCYFSQPSSFHGRRSGSAVPCERTKNRSDSDLGGTASKNCSTYRGRGVVCNEVLGTVFWRRSVGTGQIGLYQIYKTAKLAIPEGHSSLLLCLPSDCNRVRVFWERAPTLFKSKSNNSPLTLLSLVIYSC